MYTTQNCLIVNLFRLKMCSQSSVMVMKSASSPSSTSTIGSYYGMGPGSRTMPASSLKVSGSPLPRSPTPGTCLAKASTSRTWYQNQPNTATHPRTTPLGCSYCPKLPLETCTSSRRHKRSFIHQTENTVSKACFSLLSIQNSEFDYYFFHFLIQFVCS